MNKLLFILVCGLLWCWRGYSKPANVKGYLRAFITAGLIVVTYVWMSNKSLLNNYYILSIVILTAIESLLGYGNTCEDIDWYKIIYSKNWKGLLVRNGERFCYLGLIGMCYYLLPALTMSFSPVKLLLIASIGSLIFPVSKVLQMFIFNDLAIKYNLDSWKMVEFIIGMGFILWLI